MELKSGAPGGIRTHDQQDRKPGTERSQKPSEQRSPDLIIVESSREAVTVIYRAAL